MTKDYNSNRLSIIGDCAQWGQTYTKTDIATARLNRPQGRISEYALKAGEWNLSVNLIKNFQLNLYKAYFFLYVYLIKVLFIERSDQRRLYETTLRRDLNDVCISNTFI